MFLKKLLVLHLYDISHKIVSSFSHVCARICFSRVNCVLSSSCRRPDDLLSLRFVPSVVRHRHFRPQVFSKMNSNVHKGCSRWLRLSVFRFHDRFNLSSDTLRQTLFLPNNLHDWTKIYTMLLWTLVNTGCAPGWANYHGTENAISPRVYLFQICTQCNCSPGRGVYIGVLQVAPTDFIVVFKFSSDTSRQTLFSMTCYMCDSWHWNQMLRGKKNGY